MASKELSVTTTTLIESIATVFLLSCVPVTIKYVSANTFTIAFLRLFFAVLCFCIFFSLKRPWPKLSSLPRRHWKALMGLGFFFCLHWITYFFSIKVSTAAIGAISLSTYGIHLVVLGWFLLGYRVCLSDIAAIVIAIIGNILIVPEFSFENNITLGLCLGVFSGFVYAFLPIIHQRNTDIPLSLRAFGQFSFALVLILPFLLLTEWNFPSSDWKWLLFLGVICTFVAHTMWARATTRLSTATASIVSYLYVPSAMVLSSTFLSEEITSSMILGAALIIGGNILAISSQWRRTAIMAAPQPAQSTSSMK